MECTINSNKSSRHKLLLVLPVSQGFMMHWITITLVVLSHVAGSWANLCTDPSALAIKTVMFEQSTPKGGTQAGKYEKDNGATDLPSCVLSCCKRDSCNVVFLYGTICYLITCDVANPSACDPYYRKESKFAGSVMVLVREVGTTDHTHTTTTPSYDKKSNSTEGKFIALLSRLAARVNKHKLNKNKNGRVKNANKTSNLHSEAISNPVTHTSNDTSNSMNTTVAPPGGKVMSSGNEGTSAVMPKTTSSKKEVVLDEGDHNLMGNGNAEAAGNSQQQGVNSLKDEGSDTNSPASTATNDDLLSEFSATKSLNRLNDSVHHNDAKNTDHVSKNTTSAGKNNTSVNRNVTGVSENTTGVTGNTTAASVRGNTTTGVAGNTTAASSTTGNTNTTSVGGNTNTTAASVTGNATGVTGNAAAGVTGDTTGVTVNTTMASVAENTTGVTGNTSSAVGSLKNKTAGTTEDNTGDIRNSTTTTETHSGPTLVPAVNASAAVIAETPAKESEASPEMPASSISPRSGDGETKDASSRKTTESNAIGLHQNETDAELKNLVKSHTSPSASEEDLEGSHESTESSPETNEAEGLPPRKKDISCIYGLKNECEPHEECAPKNSRTRSGWCNCIAGYTRDKVSGWCLPQSKEKTSSHATKSNQSSLVPSPEKKSGNTSATPPPLTTTTTKAPTSPPVMQLVVSAGKNQTIQLPTNVATLSAYVVPEAPEGEQYKYVWLLSSHPEGAETGSMQGKNSNKLKLSNLIAGVYVFEVQVSAPGKFGKAKVNITVLPEKRINKPPVAVIKPPFQEIHLPNSAVLDGSESTDDDKIVKYVWEEVLGPLQEQKLENNDKPMLMLPKLAPGKYRFKLTVTDSDGAKNATTANVTVLKEVDYPPQANAGSNIIISLPQNSVTLYGNKSTDDHGIVSYEWIKKSDDKLTADMKGVRSPNLQLNKLEVGDYTFTLKVTDTGGMTSTADVHVFVKPEQNQPPVASAGKDRDIILPATTAILDGSKSTDDQQVVRYQWTQISGPGGIAIQDADKAVATVTNLKLGEYQFRLTVFDAEKVEAQDMVKIHVKENSNLAPKADAGGDKIVYLPQRTIFVDGSKSKDDKAITDWLWTRDDTSLAAGDIVNGSDHQPILQVTNVVAGRYVFILKVADADGLSSIDTASIIVRQDKRIKNLIEMHIKADLKSFTEANKKNWASQLSLLLHKPSQNGDTQVEILRLEEIDGELVTYFYVNVVGRGSKETWSGPEVVSTLKRKFLSQADMLDYSVSFIDTVVCQNNCSGHGTCDTASRRCLCDPFWMENFFKAHFSYKEYNCDWSILYVIIIAFLIVIALGGMFWGAVFAIRRYRRMRPRKRHRYQLLEEFDDKNSLSLKPRGKMQNSSLMVSESDATSDEETIFVNSKKANGHLRKTNGFLKHTKKLKA